MDPIRLLVISDPTASNLRLLEKLPEPVEVRVGNDVEFLKTHAPAADVILNGSHHGELLHQVLPCARHVKWIHVLSAGVDKILFPELIDSLVPVTNGRGVFKDSLAEFSIASILFFAKDLRRLVSSQEAGRWEQFDVVQIRGHVLGVVGYGEIGRETARLARSLGMKVVAVRRRAGLSASDRDLEHVYPPEGLREMLGASDYVVVSTPLTSETRALIGDAELRAMKGSAVIINIGRGPVIVESALIAALTEKRIRGAALDVFDVEPLPTGHPFYRLDNVLLSPHSADHIVGWADAAMNQFIENFERFRNDKPLENVVDKKAGY
ncbi:MAG TPA: D-2-hydroxyacid dehydrogenase [Bryobacteraceae bacterium]|jgi:phosphoglycerate dehydrogenase-like enzyme|nr:D-2-hydroxyacid dehydrogenase [Bryobacteraceae bacterium]